MTATKKQRTLPDILKEIVEGMTITVNYTLVTESSGIITLSGVCDLHHVQPGYYITINGNSYKVDEISSGDVSYTIDLVKGSNPTPAENGSFTLYPAFFFHGTPIKAENDLDEIKSLKDKTPMVYLMEPFQFREPAGFDNAIINYNVTLCFLTEADTKKWRTADYYHNSIEPMYRLAQDFLKALDESTYFSTDDIQPTFASHTEFEIRIRDAREKGQFFSDNLSGVTMDVTLSMYKDLSCCDSYNLLATSRGQYIRVSG